MRFPKWALESDNTKIHFLLCTAALAASPSGSLTDLANLAGVSAQSLFQAKRRGVITAKMAEKVCRAAPESGIIPQWLSSPSWTKVDPDTGEVIG